VDGINGLRMHVLEAGFEQENRPCLLLLHGFPELAYSWRKLMLPLAGAGYHVIAPDQRGYGRTTGGDGALASVRMLNLVRDAMGLVSAFGYREVAAVIGHDFGSPVAGWAALVRPDMFRRVVMMSTPFPGTPALPFGTLDASRPLRAAPDIHAALAALNRPRKHYQWYYSTDAAAVDMDAPPQGMHDFLRAYYHVKSADWAGNRPHPLTGWTADELAKMPDYYVMDEGLDMAATAAAEMPSAQEVAACVWLSDAELAVYAAEYARTGFGPSLLWYRAVTSGAFQADFELFSGRAIDVPACFIAGASDWGIHQSPGALEAMKTRGCTQLLGCHILPGAGHWVQQEQADAVADLVLDFLAQRETASQ